MKNLGLLLLSLALLVPTGCVHRGDARSVDVDFLWVRTQAGRPTGQGGLTRARVSLVPNEDQSVRVGVLEESPGGIGETWRASVWLAAVMSAMSTGEDLDAHRITVEADGFIDGPSAGALMTAAMMAARRGVPARADVTMTGTVNPDGSVGPVGGVPLKISAAIRKGKRIIGYPIGQGTARDPVSGGIVNVVELARSRGAEAVEIDDVEAAYALLTGTRRSRPRALSLREMRPDENLRRELAARSAEWLRMAQTDLDGAGGAASEGGEMASYWKGVPEKIEEAHRYLSRGDVCAAYWHAVGARLQAQAVASLSRYAKDAGARGFGPALSEIRKLSLATKKALDGITQRFRDRFERSRRATLSELDAMEAVVSAGIHVAEASAVLQEIAKRGRGGPAAGPGPAVADLAGPIYSLVIAEANMRLADDTLAIQAVLGRHKGVHPAGRRRFTTLFTRAAQANLHYFESVFVDQMARAQGVSREVALQRFVMSDHSYQAARAHAALSEIPLLGAGTMAQELARMASAMASYFLSSSLVAQYDSFELKRDPTTGEPVDIGNEDVFWRMLALAERKAREHAASALDKTGEIPMPALVSYEIGRVYQERPSLEDKLEALEMFWRASMWSQLAVNL